MGIFGRCYTILKGFYNRIYGCLEVEFFDTFYGDISKPRGKLLFVFFDFNSKNLLAKIYQFLEYTIPALIFSSYG